MPVLLRVSFQSDAFSAQVDEALRELEGRREDMHADIGEYLVLAVDDRFREERAPDGTAWAPLSPATLLTKKGKKILQEKGNRGGLRGSINYRATEDEVRIGSAKKYARVHQVGIGRRSSVRTGRVMPAIPARPYLGISEVDREEVRAIMAEHLADWLGGV